MNKMLNDAIKVIGTYNIIFSLWFLLVTMSDIHTEVLIMQLFMIILNMLKSDWKKMILPRRFYFVFFKPSYII